MGDQIYEQALKRINSSSKNDSEKKVNKLFLDLGFHFVDCNIIIRRNKEIVGEIDGIFKIDDDFLFLIEIDNQARRDSKKIGEFFSKWSNESNIDLIFKKYGKKHVIPHEIKIIKIFIDCIGKRPILNKPRESLRHHEEETNKILYKEDVEYFTNSHSIIGSWAKNDLLSSLNLDAKGTSIQKNALRIFMGGTKAFLFTASAYELLKSCYIYRKNEGSISGYQRILKANRINKIKKAIENKSILAFPNSIILSSKERLEKKFEGKSGPCIIDFPTNYLSFKVVDGQHRLMGFANLDEQAQKDHFLPIVAFEEMKKEDELKTFITINTEQKNIDSNLLLMLKADFDWEEEDKFFKEKIATLINKRLNDNKNFFLHNKIFLGYNAPRKGKITLTSLVSTMLKNNFIGGKYHLLQLRLSDQEKPYQETKKIFEAMKIKLEDYSNIQKLSNAEGFFLSNSGVRIAFRLIQFLIRNKNKGNIDIDYGEFFEDISSVLNKNKVVELMKNYGDGGANNATDKIFTYLKQKRASKYNKFLTDLKKI